MRHEILSVKAKRWSQVRGHNAYPLHYDTGGDHVLSNFIYALGCRQINRMLITMTSIIIVGG